MERHIGQLLRHLKSHTEAYQQLSNSILHILQLRNIRMLYGELQEVVQWNAIQGDLIYLEQPKPRSHIQVDGYDAIFKSRLTVTVSAKSNTSA